MLALVQVSLALKALYEDDIVVEELIIAWHGKQADHNAKASPNKPRYHYFDQQ